MEVSQLVFHQRRELVSDLASRGVKANCVVIADDENLEIAKHYGFDTLEMQNKPVGRKVNAGFEYAAKRGGEVFAFVGSDDWMHLELFSPLFAGTELVISAPQFTLVDLSRARMTKLTTGSHYGAIPWLIPRSALEPCRFRPVDDDLNQGLDYSLFRRIRKHPWIFWDRHPFALVDFKSQNNITPYEWIGRSVGATPEQPLGALREWYPGALVDIAEEIACL